MTSKHSKLFTKSKFTLYFNIYILINLFICDE